MQNRTITISILKAVEPGVDPTEFLELIDKIIYFELDNII